MSAQNTMKTCLMASFNCCRVVLNNYIVLKPVKDIINPDVWLLVQVLRIFRQDLVLIFSSFMTAGLHQLKGFWNEVDIIATPDLHQKMKTLPQKVGILQSLQRRTLLSGSCSYPAGGDAADRHQKSHCQTDLHLKDKNNNRFAYNI